MNDAVPICRSVLDHWIFQDPDYFKSWFAMIARARYIREPKIVNYQGTQCEVNYGEIIFGLNKWSSDYNISVQRLRTLIKRLTADRMIEVVRHTNKFTIYRLTNFEKFNSQEVARTVALSLSPNSQSTGKQQSANSQSTTNEEGTKKVKNVVLSSLKKNVLPCSEFVFLTVDEQRKLIDKHGEQGYNRIIEILDSYKGNTEKKTFGKSAYKDDYRTILQWVEQKYIEEKTKHQPLKPDRRNII
jgi:predicted secreted protein